MQHDTLCNVELRRAIILQSILYWALHSTSGPAVQGPNTGKGINRGCIVGVGGEVQVQGPVQGHRGHPEVIWEGWATLEGH